MVAVAHACGETPTGPESRPHEVPSPSINGVLASVPLANCGAVSVIDLQGKDGATLGTATLSNDEHQLTLLIQTVGEWELAKSQLAITDSLGQIPMNRTGAPQTGRFPYSAVHETGTTQFAHAIPLADLAAQTGDELIVALHVDLVDRNDPADPDDDRLTGAWGDGTMFDTRSKGNTARYSTFTVQACDDGIEAMIAEAVAVADAVTINVRRSSRSSFAEAVAVTDAVTINVLSTLRSAVAEGVSVSDDVAITVVAAPRSRVSESVGVTDQVTIDVRSSIKSNIAEAVGVTEEVAITVVPLQAAGWVQDSVLPPGGEWHDYLFEGKAGQVVRTHVSLLDDVSGSARMSVVGPSNATLYPAPGSPAAEGWSTSLSSAHAVLALAADGIYTLRITSAAAGARYRVGLGTGIGRRDPAFTAVAVPRGTDSGLHFLGMVLDGDEILTIGGRWLRRFSDGGALVSSFGSGGSVDLSAVLGASGKALSLQPDGKILVAARVTIAPYPWKVARFESNGTLDPTFGVAGIVTLAGLGTNSDSQPVGIALQANGLDLDIVVGGIAGFNLEKVGIARLKPDGSLDTTFGGGDGLVVENGGSGFGPIGFAIDSQHRILLLDDQSMRRYQPDGARDPSFGNDGLTHWTNDLGVSNLARAAGLSVLPNDRIAIVGVSSADGFIMKLQSSGQLDNSFAGTGWITPDFGLRERLQSVVEDPAGNLIVVGHQRTSEAGTAADYEYLVARFRASGEIDGPFGHAGYTVDHRADDALSAALDSSGRLIVGGESPAQRSSTGVQVLRLLLQ